MWQVENCGWKPSQNGSYVARLLRILSFYTIFIVAICCNEQLCLSDLPFLYTTQILKYVLDMAWKWLYLYIMRIFILYQNFPRKYVNSACLRHGNTTWEEYDGSTMWPCVATMEQLSSAQYTSTHFGQTPEHSQRRRGEFDINKFDDARCAFILFEHVQELFQPFHPMGDGIQFRTLK